MAVRHCPECQSPVSASEIEFRTCEACGARLPASRHEEDEEPRERRPNRRTAQLRSEPDPESHDVLMKQAKKQASVTLFVVAALMMVCGSIAVAFLGNQEGAAPEEIAIGVVLVIGMAAVFAGLGFWAMFMPVPPAIIGLVFFVGITVLDFVGDPAMAVKGIFLRIIIIVMLVKAINTAVKASKVAPKKREYEDEG